jgi:hypothetical protein
MHSTNLAPPCSYACEVFTKNLAETAIVLNAFRLGFGLSVTFYINEWVALMAFRWTYGMMAFLQLLSFCFIVLLMWKGHGIRQWRIRGLGDSEEGEHLVGKRD